MKSLAPQEIKNYADNGFAIVRRNIFSDADFDKLKLTVNKILISNGNRETSTSVGYLLGRHPEVLFWILSDNILNIVEDILGPNIGYLNSTIFYKKANTPDKAYWHTDTSGFSAYNLFEDENLVNLTISISKSTVSNGCVRYIPKTHFKKINHDWMAPKNNLIANPISIDEKNLDLSSAVNAEMDENNLSVHNVNCVHSSFSNTSNEDRITLSTRFFSASTRCNIKNFEKSNLWLLKPLLVRGNDVGRSGLPKFSLG